MRQRYKSNPETIFGEGISSRNLTKNLGPSSSLNTTFGLKQYVRKNALSTMLKIDVTKRLLSFTIILDTFSYLLDIFLMVFEIK